MPVCAAPISYIVIVMYELRIATEPKSRNHSRNKSTNMRAFGNVNGRYHLFSSSSIAVWSLARRTFFIVSIRLRIEGRTHKGKHKELSIWCAFGCDVRSQDATKCFITLPYSGSTIVFCLSVGVCNVMWCVRKCLIFSRSNSIVNWPRGKHFLESTHFACVSQIMS